MDAAVHQQMDVDGHGRRPAPFRTPRCRSRRRRFRGRRAIARPRCAGPGPRTSEMNFAGSSESMPPIRCAAALRRRRGSRRPARARPLPDAPGVISKSRGQRATPCSAGDIEQHAAPQNRRDRIDGVASAARRRTTVRRRLPRRHAACRRRKNGTAHRCACPRGCPARWRPTPSCCRRARCTRRAASPG